MDARLLQRGGYNRFPLTISANGRYFNDAYGNPFFLCHDAGWLASIQLNPAQIDFYLNDRAVRGFTGIIYQMNNVPTSSQVPTYRQWSGQDPFTTMTDSGDGTNTPSAIDFSTSNPAYNVYVDYFFKACYKRDMAVICLPDYAGFPGGSPPSGFLTATMGDTSAHLQAYGALLMRNWGGLGNIIWGMAGDNSLTQAQLSQQWNIVLGMRSVRTDFLLYVKGQRNTSGAALVATNTASGGSYPGFNVNNGYLSNGTTPASTYTHVSGALTEYARTPTMPFFVDEMSYELIASDLQVRIGFWGPALSGACGISFGNEWLYGFGGANNPPEAAIGVAASLTPTYLATNGAAAAGVASNYLRQYAWHTLVPKSDTSLVTTSLGSGISTIAAALGNNGQFAMVYAQSGFTVDRTAITHTNIRARWIDPTNGAVTVDAASPMPNTGTHAFTVPGVNSLGVDSDWVLILD